ncbi:hypothetical protein G9A89_014458 [Geosiphon pyriformis]|nr:hypothetical protein G9A89_014458 [Geosiphon pyriformis]
MQLPIFAISSVIENALEKNRKLWLVLQDMWKAYDSTVAISINCRVANLVLTVSGSPISIAKKGVLHHYLGIFLSSDGLLKLSLAKAHLDDALICKDLKSKSGLPLDFPNNTLHHPFLYNLKTFEQIQAEDKSVSVIVFVNSVGVLGHLFAHQSHDLQAFSWHSRHPLLFSAHVSVSPLNNFLAGVVCVFSGCDLSLGGSLANAFRFWGGIPMSLVLGEKVFFKCVLSLKHYSITFVKQLHGWDGDIFDWKTFKHWKRLDSRGPVPSWFDLSVRFLGGTAFFSVCSSHSFGFGAVCNSLLNAGANHLSVYTDGSLSNLGTIDIKAGAAVFFEDINLGLGVGVSGLVSSILVELQAIVLALECVSSFHAVNLFSDSQAALDACRLESLLVGPDYRNHCWIKCCHIANVIHRKNLNVNWFKVKGHSGILDNEHADALARDAALSAWCLLHLVNERFIKAGVDAVSGNSRHFVHNVFRSIHCAYWEVGSGSQVVPASLHADIDWLKSSLVWHPDSHLASGFTSVRTAGFRTYFMKAFHHQLPVAVVVCLFCGNIEVLDHIFSCPFEAAGHARLLDDHALAWEIYSGLVQSSLCISQLLSTCIANAAIGTALYKGFVFSDWFCESVSVFKDFKVVTLVIVDFMRAFCLFFWDDIWLVYAKHWAFMEKNRLISHDGSVSVLVFGSTLLFSPGVVRLLSIAEAFGIGFGFHKSCLFFSGIDNVVSIHISA